MQIFTCVGDSFVHLSQNTVNNKGPNLEVIFGLRQLASVLGVRGSGGGESKWGNAGFGGWFLHVQWGSGNCLPFSGLRSSACETQLLAILRCSQDETR